MPVADSDETVKVVAMERDFHVDCYSCETCGMQLTDEPEKRCYPLDQHLLCQNCHLQWIKFGSNFPNGSSELVRIKSQNSTSRINSQVVLERVKRDSIHGDLDSQSSLANEQSTIESISQINDRKLVGENDALWVRKGIMKVRSNEMYSNQCDSSGFKTSPQKINTSTSHKDPGELPQGRPLKMSLPRRQLHFDSDEELNKLADKEVRSKESKNRVRIVEPVIATSSNNSSKIVAFQKDADNNYSSSSLERRKQ